MSNNPFAILKDYPQEGPAVPERTKVVRTKDHHESGTGRVDKTKRQGKGPSNWGNEVDDFKNNRGPIEEKVETEEKAQEGAEEKKEEVKKVEYKPAFGLFDDSEDEEIHYAEKPSKSEARVDAKFIPILSKKAVKDIIIKKEEEVEEFEVGFLNSKEAIKTEFKDRLNNKPRGPKGQFQRRNDESRPPRRNDDRPPRRERPAEEKAEGQKPVEGEEKKRNHPKAPRDQRPGNVQHQRTQGGHQGNKPRFTMAQFPSL